MSETAEERAKRFSDLRESIAKELTKAYPSITFDRNKYGIDIIYYTVSYWDGIRIEKRKRGIHNSVPNLSSFYLTKEDARHAISKYVPYAKSKFKRFREALTLLQKDLGFEVSYLVEGDTHGIDNDYMYIAFKDYGFDFTFRLDND